MPTDPGWLSELDTVHVVDGQRVIERHEPPWEVWARLQREQDTSDCNCGAWCGPWSHTVHENNPTGHAVGCPVYARWKAAQE